MPTDSIGFTDIMSRFKDLDVEDQVLVVRAALTPGLRVALRALLETAAAAESANTVVAEAVAVPAKK